MKKIVVLLGVFLMVFSINAQDSKIPQNIKDHIQARVENDFNVGVIVGLVEGDSVEYYSLGKTAVDNGTKINENSVFEIGSISKVFTTILLANKIKKGEISLEDPISKYLPETVKTPSRNGKIITIKDLATHTSALPRMPNNFAPKDQNNPFADYTYEQLYSFLSNYQLTRDIGVTYEYSNLGMGLLGHVLELQSGKTYEELVIETIAKPLEMKDTAITFTEAMKKRLAKGHVSTIEVANWDIITLGGAGGIRSTANDMVKFLKANMGVNKTKLYHAMQLSHQSAFKDKTSDFEIGLGWHYDNNIIWHNGQTGGYNSFTAFIKGTQKGVVVLTNSTENIATIGFNLLGMSKPLKEIKKAKTIAPEILETYVGKYELAPNFNIVITTKDGHLFAQATGQSQFEIYASDENTFYYKVVKATIEFSANAEGEIDTMTLFQNGRTIPGKKIE
ncbi:serine hydrolase [uncultured Lacinutrix sp.]|uniref:serine hydrolase n=1 Tax=uncultured Lacinutrix sp. TaxID=574032 RepID=UPI0026194915|nr:serine hydrolase [uncultured Lacinutrix sp.]